MKQGQTKPCDEFVESFNLPMSYWITRDVCLTHGKDKLTSTNTQEKSGLDKVLRRRRRSKSSRAGSSDRGKKYEKRWRLVRPSDIISAHRRHVRVSYFHRDGGLVIRAQSRTFGCGREDPSGLITYIKGDWTRIRYRQRFFGSASCWDIFGSLSRKYLGSADNGLYPFDRKKGDKIRYQRHMRSRNGRLRFDGKVSRCDNTQYNFWHSRNGQNERSAMVQLRRRSGTTRAGISTAVSCGKPSWQIDNIYVYA
eukprot:TRINITY_DN653_c0_g1_i1.p1 TRINITY_DN653_c0_g1~~TRINITY_DN653_c0_g1_i1.p1  ORF type:complete len:252 (+),score=61.09 TRINITY_DN653_c0_g1_i1:760-1515(+)